MKISVLTKIKAYSILYFLRFFELWSVLNKIKKTYKHIPTYSISKEYRLSQEPKNTDLIYGELSVLSFLYLLGLIPKTKNVKIYDLGCGDGILLLSAVLFYKRLNAVGIEKIADLQKIAVSMKKAYQADINKNHASLDFFQDSFLNKDFFDGNIVYINGAALGKATWDVLNERLNKLAKNSYLISVENKLSNPFFSMIYKGIHSASWGKARVYIYQKN